MKTSLLILAAVFALSSPLMAMEHDHSGHTSGMTHSGNAAHEEVIDGVKATFKVISMKEQMKGMEMPTGMKETHHIMVEFKDIKSGKALTKGEVKVRVQSPDKREQSKEMMGMQGHFGADFDLSKSGKYGIVCMFTLGDGKTHRTQFRYQIK